MLFKKHVLEKIASGEIRLALRRWSRPTVKTGGRLRTAIGVLRIGDVVQVCEADISKDDAIAAGYADRQSALAELGDEQRGALYRVALDGLEPDPRVRLRSSVEMTNAEWTAIALRLERWKQARPILERIESQPEVAAGTLADALGIEKQKFKRDVRSLKDLGLTESLDLGYRLSPRGQAVLKRLRQTAIDH